jgi:hypothetical protein
MFNELNDLMLKMYVQWGSMKSNEEGSCAIGLAILLFIGFLVLAAALQGRSVQDVVREWGLK